LVLIHGDEEGMISGFAGADVETIASICTNRPIYLLERPVKL